MLKPTGWYLVLAPVDLRFGVDRLMGHVVNSLGTDPWMARPLCFATARDPGQGAVCRCTRRVVEHASTAPGRFHWPRANDATWDLTLEQFQWLSAGVD